jgi:hypothetical protein
MAADYSPRTPAVIDVLESAQLAAWTAAMGADGSDQRSIVLGPLVVPATTFVGRAALYGDFVGRSALAFALALPDSPPQIVRVEGRWTNGLPLGRQGAFALAEAIRVGLGRAVSTRSTELLPLVAAVGEEVLAVMWVGAVQAHAVVGPVLDNAGFDLLARPGSHASVATRTIASINYSGSSRWPLLVGLAGGGASIWAAWSSANPSLAVAGIFIAGIGLAGSR